MIRLILFLHSYDILLFVGFAGSHSNDTFSLSYIRGSSERYGICEASQIGLYGIYDDNARR
jgi:hypothetical protein